MADPSSDKISLTRRQAVAALGAGIAVVGGAAALTGVEATAWAKRDAEQQIQDMQFRLTELEKKNGEAQKQLAAAQLQIELYKGLTGLYDTLDKIGLDAIVGSALGAYKTSLDALEGGVRALREGIVSAENALDHFENAFASIRVALTTAENAWANVTALLKNAQDLIAQATSPVLPLVDQATKFFDDLLGKIPFGGGEGARQAIRGVIGLIVAIPSALDALDDGLFRTLREGWFSDDSAQNLEATLARPIVNGVLAPARQFLDRVETTLNGWEEQVARPVNGALSQREIVQKQIAQYKSTHGLS
jgi:exonuclease VII small subunit